MCVAACCGVYLYYRLHRRWQVFQLNDILLGQQTETFKLLPTAGLAVVSFSLLFDDRTLDVVVKSVRERLWWVAHILYLHKMLRPHATKSIAESLRTQVQVAPPDCSDVPPITPRLCVLPCFSSRADAMPLLRAIMLLSVCLQLSYLAAGWKF